MTKYNIAILSACFIPVYLVIGGVIVFHYLNMSYSPLALIISIMFANLFTYLNLKSVMKTPITSEIRCD